MDENGLAKVLKRLADRVFLIGIIYVALWFAYAACHLYLFYTRVGVGVVR